MTIGLQIYLAFQTKLHTFVLFVINLKTAAYTAACFQAAGGSIIHQVLTGRRPHDDARRFEPSAASRGVGDCSFSFLCIRLRLCRSASRQRAAGR